MVILRVLMGRGWTKEVTTDTAMRFPSASRQDIDVPSGYGASETAINLHTISRTAGSIPETEADKKV